MKFLFRQGLLGLLLSLIWLPAAFAQTGLERISRIVVTNVGPPVVSEDLVRANIHVKPGDRDIRASVDDDVRNLYQTGYFNNIQVLDTLQDGGVVLTYILQGKLKLTSLKFVGNTKYSDTKLLKKVTSKIGEPIDDRKLFSDCLEIEQMYAKAGYPHTTVHYFPENTDERAGKSGVRFEIKEGLKIKIIDITFEGAKAFPQKKLRKEIKTRRHWMFSWLTRSGIFKDEQFEDDKEKLAEFYRKEGYIDFELLDVRIVNPTPRTMTIQFVVSEGNQYRVGGVAFKGNLLFGTNEIFAGLKLQHERNKSKTKIGPHGLEADVGMIFKPDSFDNDIKGIEDFYGARGYIDVKRGGNLRARRIPNTKTGTMDLEDNIDSGQKSYIEKIIIKGNAKTKDRVIRRELAVAPGEVFDMVKVRLSKERLEGLDYFEKVDTKNEATVVPERKDLVIGVDEKSTGQFTFGAGFNTVDSLLGYVELEQRNFDLFKPPYFTGGGEKFRLRVQLGFERQDYLADFVEPWFLNRKLTLSVSLYRSVLNFQSLNSLYDVTRTGVRVGLSRALGSDFLIGGVGVNLEDVGINNVNTNAPDAILRDAGSKVLERFSASLAYDTRNSTGLSTKGQRTELLGEITTGDRTFLKTELKSEWYFKGFAEGHVIEIGGKAGVAQRLGSQDVPFYDRYYLGGQDHSRGYDYRAVGPRAVSQDGAYYEPIGGDTYWLGSIEYSVPIIPRLRFALFYDIGNVSARPWSNSGYPVQGRRLIASPPDSIVGPSGTVGSTGDFSDNYGIGLRLNLPIAPLRLDYGIPLTHDPFSSGSGKFQFSVGFSRPF